MINKIKANWRTRFYRAAESAVREYNLPFTADNKSKTLKYVGRDNIEDAILDLDSALSLKWSKWQDGQVDYERLVPEYAEYCDGYSKLVNAGISDEFGNITDKGRNKISAENKRTLASNNSGEASLLPTSVYSETEEKLDKYNVDKRRKSKKTLAVLGAGLLGIGIASGVALAENHPDPSEVTLEHIIVDGDKNITNHAPEIKIVDGEFNSDQTKWNGEIVATDEDGDNLSYFPYNKIGYEDSFFTASSEFYLGLNKSDPDSYFNLTLTNDKFPDYRFYSVKDKVFLEVSNISKDQDSFIVGMRVKDEHGAITEKDFVLNKPDYSLNGWQWLAALSGSATSGAIAYGLSKEDWAQRRKTLHNEALVPLMYTVGLTAAGIVGYYNIFGGIALFFGSLIAPGCIMWYDDSVNKIKFLEDVK